MNTMSKLIVLLIAAVAFVALVAFGVIATGYKAQATTLLWPLGIVTTLVLFWSAFGNPNSNSKNINNKAPPAR